MFKGNYFRNGNDQRVAFRNFCDLRAGIRGDWSPPRRRGWGSILTFGKGARTFCPTAGFLLGQSETLTPTFAPAGRKLARTDHQNPTSLNISQRSDQRDLMTPRVITQGAIRANMLVLVPLASGPHLNYICSTVSVMEFFAFSINYERNWQ